MLSDPTEATVATESRERLARRYGTPLYLYRLDRLRRADADLRRVLPDPAVTYYSLKANRHPDLVACLARCGCEGEVSSTGELDAALSAGMSAAGCLYTGPGKTVDEVEHALRNGVRRFSVESATQLDLVARSARRTGREVDCLLRVNPEPGAGARIRMTGPSQFGIDVSELESCPQRFGDRPAVRVRGLHFFPASAVDDVDDLLDTFAASVTTAARLGRDHGYPLDEIALGGGFAAPYAQDGEPPDYRPLRGGLERLLDGHLPGWREGGPRIAFESGRYLAGTCGSLLCSVVDVKRSGGRTFVVLDTGINHVAGIAGSGRSLPATVRPRFPGPDRGDDDRMNATVVGPLCTPADVLARRTELPSVRVGDLVEIPNTGAYGLVSGLTGFLGRPAPVEVVVDGDTVVSATALESVRTPRAGSAADDRGTTVR